MYCQLIRRELAAQALDYIPVDFHYMQMIERPQQRPGQGTQPRTDFNQEIAVIRTNRGNDFRYGAGIDEEVLAETLAGNVLH
jgi:hypothetical protein